MALSQTKEDYLKTIYILSKTKDVHVSDLADELGVSRPTVSVAIKKLEKAGYILRRPDHEILLSEKGRSIAEAVYERHSTFCGILEKLGVGAETAERDACRLEHAVSQESFQAIQHLMELAGFVRIQEDLTGSGR